jgi:hypothetical protein
MNKRALVGGTATLLAGIGIYRYIEAKNGGAKPEEAWTTADIPDLSSKVIVVTGANSGIGFETAKALAQKGALTILACRDRDRAEGALRRIQAQAVDASAEIILLDLASLAAVRRFAAEFKEKYDRLNVCRWKGLQPATGLRPFQAGQPALHL